MATFIETLLSDPGLLAATGVASLLLLILTLFMWLASKRQYALRALLDERDRRLSALLSGNRKLQQESHAKDIELSGRSAEVIGLRQQLSDREQLLARQQDIERTITAERERDRAQLARTQAELRGQTVALQEREERHEGEMKVLSDAQDTLKREFQVLANRIFEDKGKSFTSTSQASLEAMLKPFREQITGFQSRIDQVHTESVKGNTALEKEIKRVLEIGLEMNTQASNLSSALKGDKKTTGNWGEAQLERSLELAGLQAGEHYDSQAVFKDEAGRRKLPDFVIKLPDGKNLVLDSKVSLVDYDRAIAADTEEQRSKALAAHALAVRNHIDDLSKKDYAKLPGIGSPDFVLMFMPIEPAYIEAMKSNRDLFNYGYNKNVVMVSHTTLMPILRTVANLWIVDKGNREARDISDKAGDLYNQVARVVDRFGKLGSSLRAVQGHYNDTLLSLVGQQGLRSKTQKFKEVSARANKPIAELEPLGDDLELERLEVVAIPGEAETPQPEAAIDKAVPISTEQDS